MTKQNRFVKINTITSQTTLDLWNVNIQSGLQAVCLIKYDYDNNIQYISLKLSKSSVAH